MISDFCWAEVQDGWLECDGSDVNISTYGTLFAVMTIQQNGTRTSGSAVITSLTSTSNMKVGYYVYGVGIPEDTTILSINSATQITMSANAGSTGTTTVIVSPWRMGAGTIRLPDLSTAGRFRRSRTSTTRVGELQSSANLSHSHSVVGNTGVESATHTHNVTGNTGTESADHTHGYSAAYSLQFIDVQSGALPVATAYSNFNTTGRSAAHTHGFSVNSGGQSANHTHGVNITSAGSGGSETRPESIVLMTCVKT